ncbi:zf-HC2 domain-containing protein [Streptomyces sp. NPDC006385]|uniref:zf-HC2 domain-containing protein n=1 Tax=Streptomyces sp. NPDC006385 TaxID=3156761 RepID=UPI0033A5454C
MDGRSDRGAAGGCGSVREDLGANVIGALEPEENEQIGAHLAICPGCRAEHDELAKVARLLSELLPVTRVDRHPGWPSRAPSSRKPPQP